MKLSIYQVDAFTDQLFGGNPAAICPLEEWLPEETMQKIAAENNLAETAFYVRRGKRFDLRWFTPSFEIDLCGHATLATAYLLFVELGFEASQIDFNTASGILTVKKNEDLLEMDFPSRKPVPADSLLEFEHALSIHPKEVLKSNDYFLVFENEEEIRKLIVNPALLTPSKYNKRGVICTAKGNEVDFVSRFFVPGSTVFEDPVTGSAHCSLIPYWSEKLGKNYMEAHQLSQRQGKVYCSDKGDRVGIAGRAVTYLKGQISI